MSPALADGFLSTGLPEKPAEVFWNIEEQLTHPSWENEGGI